MNEDTLDLIETPPPPERDETPVQAITNDTGMDAEQKAAAINKFYEDMWSHDVAPTRDTPGKKSMLTFLKESGMSVDGIQRFREDFNRRHEADLAQMYRAHGVIKDRQRQEMFEAARIQNDQELDRQVQNAGRVAKDGHDLTKNADGFTFDEVADDGAPPPEELEQEGRSSTPQQQTAGATAKDLAELRDAQSAQGIVDAFNTCAETQSRHIADYGELRRATKEQIAQITAKSRADAFKRNAVMFAKGGNEFAVKSLIAAARSGEISGIDEETLTAAESAAKHAAQVRKDEIARASREAFLALDEKMIDCEINPAAEFPTDEQLRASPLFSSMDKDHQNAMRRRLHSLREHRRAEREHLAAAKARELERRQKLEAKQAADDSAYGRPAVYRFENGTEVAWEDAAKLPSQTDQRMIREIDAIEPTDWRARMAKAEALRRTGQISVGDYNRYTTEALAQKVCSERSELATTMPKVYSALGESRYFGPGGRSEFKGGIKALKMYAKVGRTPSKELPGGLYKRQDNTAFYKDLQSRDYRWFKGENDDDEEEVTQEQKTQIFKLVAELGAKGADPMEAVQGILAPIRAEFRARKLAERLNDPAFFKDLREMLTAGQESRNQSALGRELHRLGSAGNPNAKAYIGEKTKAAEEAEKKEAK